MMGTIRLVYLVCLIRKKSFGSDYVCVQDFELVLQHCASLTLHFSKLLSKSPLEEPISFHILLVIILQSIWCLHHLALVSVFIIFALFFFLFLSFVEVLSFKVANQSPRPAPIGVGSLVSLLLFPSALPS